jgi:hypothetical protein
MQAAVATRPAIAKATGDRLGDRESKTSAPRPSVCHPGPAERTGKGFGRQGQSAVREQIKVIPGAEAFRMGDGEVGALLLHGFTSTPDNLRGLGAYLSERGVAVSAPLLPGHGTSWQELASRRSRDRLGAAESAFHQMGSAPGRV